ncbi:hypothetical protein OsI_15061 [Oryza sativa Indica Group]|uniref:Cytochrome P450 n=1 Tax=Oryza sativa subsp. indica TaxID=39946 RepID=B8AR67_ORYSI|nr:hypothetical protein OsI_15061 [Oryza sativa Indica Group]
MAILLLVALFYRIKKQAAAMAAKRKQQPKLPPGLATMPVVRNMHQMLMNKPVFRWIHRLLDEMDTEILCLRFGRVHVIAVASPEMAGRSAQKDAMLASRHRRSRRGRSALGTRTPSCRRAVTSGGR